jgi:hypothetical protein
MRTTGWIIPVLTVARDIFDDATANGFKAFFGGVD